ncbi:cytochrome P450 [Nocardia seriolae]|uniref:Cytochrome P450 n=1 Tax=Nocardia seriolae TaxID=37332 RepID=A0A0B8NNM2_9NOCA|nr:cytochrome P450 [Nocardia seriolae]MTJ61418.1 cytochrome P450 [Nocardia seriolae]MTJ75252.1 cytochrome P450 [Nocardia seriolae]MTJ86450.1 cytochrome P450 [Nocardia seriolae]MTK30444.1 cytochrome P450 [Nocardia seriolae]MTK39388.1 cytochrome P450 [Nocardia seriolae]
MTLISPDAVDLFDPAHLDDPYPLYRRLRAESPVYRIPGSDFYLVTSWDLVTEAVNRAGEFSSHLTGALLRQPGQPPLTFDMDGGGQAIHVLATADDPSHQIQRKLVQPLLAKRIRGLGPTVTELVDRLWSEELRGDRIEWAAGMADRLPLTLVADIIGLPDTDVPQLLSWAYDSTEMLGGLVDADRFVHLATAAADLAAYLHIEFHTALANPKEDLLGVLAHAHRAGGITDTVAVLILVQLVGAGGESTAGLIANAARLLATRRELQEELRREPALLPNFLDEALRLESPFRGHHRHVTVDTALGGTEIPAGSHVLLSWGAANRDPARFEHPDAIDLDRRSGADNLAFGRGIHFCVGSALAKLEATAALTALLERTAGFALVEDAPPQWFPSIFVRRHRSLPLRVR